MKPTKNRRICPDCGRMKTFFETEKAALKFIEYNSAEIIKEGGYAPKRAYYCDLCCGWHVTSRKNYCRKSFNRRVVDNIIEMQKAADEKKAKKAMNVENESADKRPKCTEYSPRAPFLTKVADLLEECFTAAENGDIESAKSLVDQASYLLNESYFVGKAKNIHGKLIALINETIWFLTEKNTPLSINVIANIKDKLETMRRTKCVLNYDPYAPDAIHYDITPDNFEEHVESLRREKAIAAAAKEERNNQKKANNLIQEITDEISLGNFDAARTNIKNVVNLIERISNEENRELIRQKVIEAIDMLSEQLKTAV